MLSAVTNGIPSATPSAVLCGAHAILGPSPSAFCGTHAFLGPCALGPLSLSPSVVLGGTYAILGPCVLERPVLSKIGRCCVYWV